MAQLAARCAAFLTLFLAACSGGVLDAHGPVAAADRQRMLNACEGRRSGTARG